MSGTGIGGFVSTDDLQRLKQRARHIKREQGIPHHEAIEAVARSVHFDNWQQVVVAHEAMLPTETAAREGVVFAMDFKDAEVCQGRPIELPDGRYVEDELLGLFFEECVYQLARDESDEEDGRPGHEHFSEEELREFVEEALFELVFYRYEGDRLPTSADEIAQQVAGECFFGPQYIWIAGQLQDRFSSP
ncbi:plasmid-related protein [Thiorhodococcus drewsii AZ1]|uniref:Plasmid-related protein n=1 Tax=Thiorhodococcus drewsii AZ1 TaxID=765913 RepID=G2E5P3_9GAMM|nr:plasmid-related protein [Thiorhodococcus drewsii AZ1]